MAVLEAVQTGYGVARSLAIFYGRPWRFRIMDAFYARLIRRGDLCFDLGAHVGNRVRSWRKLGARVVAVEPQPALHGVLRLLYGADPEVRLVASAIAGHVGEVELHLNLANPLVSTASASFIESAAVAPSFRAEVWRRRIIVPATTIDDLISAHGVPRFIKIDIEGYEAEALRGLSQPIYAVSVEFVPMARAVAEAALDRLEALADYLFNASYGDTMRLVHPIPLSVAEIRRWLRSLGDDGPAGDLYACLEAGPISAERSGS
jgi:FkbM family methyltransferase